MKCLVWLLFGTILAGCGPAALNRSVIDYDETMADLEQKLLLINIARLHNGQPVHFTATSSIAASFNWHQSAGLSADYFLNSSRWGAADGNLSVSQSESPTFSIYPVTGTDFAERILSPVDENIFNMIQFQGHLLEHSLRLLADGIEIQAEDGRLIRFLANDPERPAEYAEFVHLVELLAKMADKRELFIRSLVFDEVLLQGTDTVPTAYDVTNAAYNGMRWEQENDGTYSLYRPKGGRVVVLNKDHRAMTNRERWHLNKSIKTVPESFVYIGIEPGGLAGDINIRGFIKLRSMVQILEAVAEDIERPIDEGDPIRRTLDIQVTESAPEGDPWRTIEYGGKYYSLADTDWDKTIFRILAWVFQSSMGEIESPGLPITISK